MAQPLVSRVVCARRSSYALLMKDWIPVISAFLGFVAGIFGTWLTQRANRQLETTKQDATRQLESDRWERERQKVRASEQKQLYVDLVEYIEDQLTWLRHYDLGIKRKVEPAKLNLHPNQLGGRVKIFASTSVVFGWEGLQRALSVVENEFAQGNVYERPDLPGRTDLHDQRVIPAAVVAGELLILVVRAEYEKVVVADLIPVLRQTLLNERYTEALDDYLAAQKVLVS